MQVRVQSSKSVRQKKTFVFYRHIVYNVFRCVFLTLYQIEGNRKKV